MAYNIHLDKNEYRPEDGALVATGTFDFDGAPVEFEIIEQKDEDPVIGVFPDTEDSSNRLHKLVTSNDDFIDEVNDAIVKFKETNANHTVEVSKFIYNEHIHYFIDVIPDAKDKRDVFTGFVSIQGGDLPAFGYKMSDTKELIGVYLWHAPDVEISNTDIPAEFADEIRRAIRLRYLTVIVKE